MVDYGKRLLIVACFALVLSILFISTSMSLAT